jgi:S1-C subfamily serine protease
MSRTVECLIGATTGLLLFLTASLLQAGLRAHRESMPSLQTLKALEYTRATTTKATALLGHSDLWNLMNAGKAYAKGAEILPRFHEPIPTRGDTGISVFKAVSPSVVMVVTANFKDDKITDSGLGTGVIIDSAGDVLTNWHVIHGFQSGIVFLKPASGTEPRKTDAYGISVISESEQTDLALLRILKPPAGLPPVQLGELSSVQVAEDIHIIGHPHGQLWSYSTGVVSQVRDNFDWHYADGSKHLARVLQMQTAINPGNSGGPVLDNSAKMLGLVAMSEEGQNLNYAVAVDVIKNFVSKALASKTRGADIPLPTEIGQSFLSRTADGLSVSKIAYADLVSYTIRDASGLPIEEIAESSVGDVLTGSKPNEFGGFSDWVFTPTSGSSVSIESSGIAPELISRAEVN